jgi:hypothetical protein
MKRSHYVGVYTILFYRPVVFACPVFKPEVEPRNLTSRGDGHFTQGELPLTNCSSDQPFLLIQTPNSPPTGGALSEVHPLALGRHV